MARPSDLTQVLVGCFFLSSRFRIYLAHQAHISPSNGRFLCECVFRLFSSGFSHRFLPFSEVVPRTMCPGVFIPFRWGMTWWSGEESPVSSSSSTHSIDWWRQCWCVFFLGADFVLVEAVRCFLFTWNILWELDSNNMKSCKHRQLCPFGWSLGCLSGTTCLFNSMNEGLLFRCLTRPKGRRNSKGVTMCTMPSKGRGIVSHPLSLVAFYATPLQIDEHMRWI